MKYAAPRLILSIGFTDANNLLAGVLYLKGFKVFKLRSIFDCLSLINQMQEKIDVLLIDEQSAAKNDFYLVSEIKKLTPDTMIVVIADENVKQRGKNIDEFILRPISPENLADKILNMLAKKELKRLRKAPEEQSNEIKYFA
jgi:response regulator RpfG family c-di-GMP phosphodiesterase